MDMQIFCGFKEYILEFKIWRGPKKEEEAYRQLSEYMKSRSAKEGYLINFVFNKTKDYKADWINYGDKEKFEINA